MNAKMKIDKVLSEVTKGARGILGDRLHSVILYGSHARGDFDDESDVDIMVLADLKEDEMWEMQMEMCDVSSAVSLENDVTVCALLKDRRFFVSHVDTLPFYRNVITEGVMVYERKREPGKVAF